MSEKFYTIEARFIENDGSIGFARQTCCYEHEAVLAEFRRLYGNRDGFRLTASVSVIVDPAEFAGRSLELNGLEPWSYVLHYSYLEEDGQVGIGEHPFARPSELRYHMEELRDLQARAGREILGFQLELKDCPLAV